MGPRWSIGLRRAPLHLPPSLYTTHNLPGDEVLAHQASAEVIPDPLFPTWEGRVGQWGSRGQRERARGPPNGLTYSTEAEIKPLLREDRGRLSLTHTESERKQK